MMPKFIEYTTFYEKIPSLIIIILILIGMYYLIKLPYMLKDKKFKDINSSLLNFYKLTYNLSNEDIAIIYEFSNERSFVIDQRLLIDEKYFTSFIIKKENELHKKIFIEKKIESKMKPYYNLKKKLFM